MGFPNTGVEVVGRRSEGLSLRERDRPLRFPFSSPKSKDMRGWVFRAVEVVLSRCGVPGFGSAFPIGRAAHHTYALSPRHTTTQFFFKRGMGVPGCGKWVMGF
jgi:hypothetical protein